MIDNSTPKLDKDSFRFVVPADLEKAADGSYRIRGLASTEKVDQQGETILQKGVDLTPIDQKKGVLNWDHFKGPENTIGILDGYQRTPKGLFIEGRLFKNHTKAKAVREIMESLGEGDRGRMGLSVEGKVLERDPLNPSIIKKCRISAVALTMNPVNADTYADVVKSMNAAEALEIDAQEEVGTDSKEATFTATQVMAMVQKALSIGAGATGAPNAKTGGDALQPSDMTSEEDKKKKKKAEEMEKAATGEGSRGGHVIGHLPNGKPVYGSKDWKPSRSYKHGDHVKVTNSRHAHFGGRGKVTHHDEKTGKVHVDFGSGKSKEFHVSEIRSHVHKSMSREMYKSNLMLVLDKLQTLYPNSSRADIWEAVKERLETKFEISKGGPGSGVKGHKTPKKPSPHRATSHHDHGDGSYTNAYLGESAENAAAAIKQIKEDPDVEVIHEKPHVSLTGKKYPSIKFRHKGDVEKAMIRIKNTSGKEREHKLYEEARQRDDYEANKDKSRAELNEIAEQSGADKHSKEKIRAQADATKQVGDRDHVRPNVKG